MEWRSKDFRRLARQRLSGKWGVSLAVTLVAGLLGGTGASSGGFSSATNLVSEDASALPASVRELLANPAVITFLLSMLIGALVVSLALYIIGSAVELGHNRYYIGLMAGETPGFGILFSRFRIFGKALGLRLFIYLFVLLWSLPCLGLLLASVMLLPEAEVYSGGMLGISLFLMILALIALVLPLWASYRYVMAPYLMAQYPQKGVRECVNESKALMQGYKWRLFCLNMSFIGWVFLSVLTLGIGNLWLNPYMYAANGAFYLVRTGQLPETR